MTRSMALRGTRNSHDDRGAVLVWVALMATILLGIGALAVDLGYAYAVKRQLSNTADAAALAGAQEAGLRFIEADVQGCTPKLKELITDAVQETHRANDPAGSTGDPIPEITCTDKNGNEVDDLTATRVTVKVDEASDLDTWFGALLGVSSLKPAATATATVSGTRFQAGLRPFLVCLNDAQTARDEFLNPAVTVKTTFQSYYAKFDNSTLLPETPRFNDVPWAAGTGIITTPGNHGLKVGDYLRLEVAGVVGAGNGYYYVVDANRDEFKVSGTRGGPAVLPTTSGTVDVYVPQPVAGGGSLWSSSTGLVTDAGHGLVNGTSVQVSIVSGADGASDGNYTVINSLTDTFQLSKDNSTAVSINSNGVINVYPVALPAAAGCNPATAPANWGYSAFDFKSGDDKQLACLIKYGYGGDVDDKTLGTKCLDADGVPGVDVGLESNGVPAEGDQGNNLVKADGQLIEALIKERTAILLPVGANWNGLGGNNAEYDGRGALAVTLCGYVLPGNAGPSLDKATSYYFSTNTTDCPGGAAAGQGLYETAVTEGRISKDTSLVIQWRFSRYVGSTVGQPTGGTAECPLGVCLGALELTK